MCGVRNGAGRHWVGLALWHGQCLYGRGIACTQSTSGRSEQQEVQAAGWHPRTWPARPGAAAIIAMAVLQFVHTRCASVDTAGGE